MTFNLASHHQATALPVHAGHGPALALTLAAVTFMVVFIGAISSILSSHMNVRMKLAWIVFSFVVPFLGGLVWFAILRRAAQGRLPQSAPINLDDTAAWHQPHHPHHPHP